MLGEPMKENLFKKYAFSAENLFKGRIWIFFTSIFLHGSVSHLILNSIALFFFGHALEKEISKKKFLAIFFLGGIVGNFANLFFSPYKLTVGASGGIFSIMGAAMLIKPFEFMVYPYLIPVPLALVGILYSVYTVLALLVGGESNIAYSAHVGGLATGLVFGLKEEGKSRGLIIVLILFLILLMTPLLVRVLNLVNYVEFLRKLI